MKSLYLVLFLFICVVINKENKKTIISGKVTYGYVQNSISKEEKDKSKELNGFLDKMYEASKDLTFNLEFNNKESLFFLKPVMDSDISPMSLSYVTNIVSRGKYYYNKQKDIILREEHIYGNNTLIKSVSSQINNWKLMNKSKKIGQYKCYKAIRKKIKQGTTKQHSFTIEAWYCPELPVSYGPKEFNGLPGLILELKDTHYTFFAKQIEIETDTIYNIKPLSSKIVITQKEHLKRMKEVQLKQ